MGLADKIVAGMIKVTEGASKMTNNNYCQGHFRYPFEVGGGKYIYLSSSRGYIPARTKANDEPEMDFGVYIDGGWKWDLKSTPTEVVMSEGFEKVYKPSFASKWDHGSKAKVAGIYLPWADRGAPPIGKVNSLMDWLNPLIEEDKKIEIACMGGHGRTGTLACCLYIYRHYGDVDPIEVIKQLREEYCKEAVESWVQVERIFEAAGKVAPPEPKKPVQQSKTGTAFTGYRGPLQQYEKRRLAIFLRSPDTTWERLGLYWNNERKEVAPTQTSFQYGSYQGSSYDDYGYD